MAKPSKSVGVMSKSQTMENLVKMGGSFVALRVQGSYTTHLS